MSPSLAAQETYVAETNFAAQKQKNVSAWSQNRDSKEVAYSQISFLDYNKSKWKIIRSQFMREQPLERKRSLDNPQAIVYHSSWKWYKMLKFLIIVWKATEGFDTMKIKVTTEDDKNESPAIMTPTKKTNEDFDRMRISPW